MRKRQHSKVLVCLAVILALLAAGCDAGADDDTSTTSTAQSTTTSVATTTTSTQTTSTVPTTSTSLPASAGHVVYFLLDELDDEAGGPFLVPVYRDLAAPDAALAVMEALVEGPTSDEVAGVPTISTAIPAGAQALGVELSDGTASVDLSSEFDDGGGSASMFARLAQVVYTLTRLPDVDQVEFLIGGEPVEVFSSEGIELDGPQARDDYYDWLPPIFVDHPAWGEPVTSPIAVSGLSNVFEAVSQVMLTDDDGAPLFEATVTATCGTGCWGEWQTEIPFTIDRDQFGALIVWELSAEDGSRINVREYPVQLRGEA